MVRLKISDNFIFGFGCKNRKYLVIIGFRHDSNPFYLEMFSSFKNMKKLNFIELT